ncbi:hypothetical protein BKA93DRAFT_748167 [Sparassis latifolia]
MDGFRSLILPASLPLVSQKAALCVPRISVSTPESTYQLLLVSNLFKKGSSLNRMLSVAWPVLPRFIHAASTFDRFELYMMNFATIKRRQSDHNHIISGGYSSGAAWKHYPPRRAREQALVSLRLPLQAGSAPYWFAGEPANPNARSISLTASAMRRVLPIPGVPSRYRSWRLRNVVQLRASSLPARRLLAQLQLLMRMLLVGVYGGVVGLIGGALLRLYAWNSPSDISPPTLCPVLALHAASPSKAPNYVLSALHSTTTIMRTPLGKVSPKRPPLASVSRSRSVDVVIIHHSGTSARRSWMATRASWGGHAPCHKLDSGSTAAPWPQSLVIRTPLFQPDGFWLHDTSMPLPPFNFASHSIGFYTSSRQILLRIPISPVQLNHTPVTRIPPCPHRAPAAFVPAGGLELYTACPGGHRARHSLSSRRRPPAGVCVYRARDRPCSCGFDRVAIVVRNSDRRGGSSIVRELYHGICPKPEELSVGGQWDGAQRGCFIFALVLHSTLCVVGAVKEGQGIIMPAGNDMHAQESGVFPWKFPGRTKELEFKPSRPQEGFTDNIRDISIGCAMCLQRVQIATCDRAGRGEDSEGPRRRREDDGEKKRNRERDHLAHSMKMIRG